MSDLSYVFQRFCGIGQTSMDGRGFLTLCKNAGFMDESFVETDAESIFNAVTLMSKRRMSSAQLGLALACVAKRKHVEPSALHRATTDILELSKDRIGMKQLRSQSASNLRRTQPRQRRTEMRCCAESLADLHTATATSQVRPRHSTQRVSQRHACRAMEPASLPALKDAKLWGRRLTATNGLTVDTSTCEYDEHEVLASASPVSSLNAVFTSLCCGQPGIQERSFVTLCQRSCLFDSEFTAPEARRIYRAHSTGFMTVDQFVKALQGVAQARGLDEGLVINMVVWSENYAASEQEEPAPVDETLRDTGDHSLDSSFVGLPGMLKLRRARYSKFASTKVELLATANTVDECCAPETPMTVSTTAFSSFSGTPTSPSELDVLSTSRSASVADEACSNGYRS